MQFLTTIILASLASASTVKPLCHAPKGSCDSFDPKHYDGKWFQIGGSELVREEWGFDCKCTAFNYLASDDGNVKMTKTSTKGLFNNRVDTLVGFMERKESPAQFKLNFPKKHFKNFMTMFAKSPNYEIKNVWTDQYGHYKHALVVAPKKKHFWDKIENHFEKFWVLSREPEMPQDELDDVLRYLNDAGFHTDKSKFKKTDQVDCAQKAPLRK